MRLNIKLNLTSNQQLRLLEGLDSWVKLGLLSHEQVRELARSLSEPIPIAQENPDLPPFASPAINPTTTVTDQEIPTVPTPPEAPRSKVSQALQTLLEEISVIWLLFLGVFLVVVSSGVLAASQWQSFSSVGQYAILLAYSLVFWGASLWAQQQETLQATAKMLALTTALLIPINFWMMDAVGVFRSPMGIAVGGFSALLLSAALIKLLAQRSNQLNLMGLSWLHLGWAGAGIVGHSSLWPVLATYLGTLGTAASLLYRDRHSPSVSNAAVSEPEASSPESPLSLDVLAIAMAMLLLLFRSLVVMQVPPHQLGLAAGICGWLFVWLNRDRANRELWQWAGFGLLFVGWAISVTHQPPWQALGVSGLALWLMADRLRQTWRKEYLLVLIGIAGQAYWLLGAVLPMGTRNAVTQAGQQLSTQTITTGEWVSLGYFPFLLGLFWLARQLSLWQQPALAKTATRAALGLGVGLTLLSLSNPFTLAVNLLLSAIALLFISHRRPDIGLWLVTLAHTVAISAIAAWVYYLWPNLTATEWAYLWLTGGLVEFALHLSLQGNNEATQGNRWRQNTHGAGLCLFALSYLHLIWASLFGNWNPHFNWLWLIVPVVLTGVANHRKALFPISLAQLTLVALVLQTPWLSRWPLGQNSLLSLGIEGLPTPWQIDWPVAITSFALGTLCMLINSRIWRAQAAALFTVGSGVACMTSILWYSFITRLNLNANYLLIVWVLEIGGLWLLARGLARGLARRSANPLTRGQVHRADELSPLYQNAATVWGGLLMLGLLLVGASVAIASLQTNPVLFKNIADYRYTLLATTLLFAMLLEAIHHRPAEWRYWSLAGSGAIALTLATRLQGFSIETVAIAFLALGLITQLAGDIWTLRHPRDPLYRPSWHGIPLAYAAIGIILGHVSAFRADSGLYTLAAGAIVLGVGRRKAELKALSYLGLVTLSIGAYELLIYQLSKSSDGQPGDGVMCMALLALAIAQGILSPWLARYLKRSVQELRGLSQGYWLLGTVLLVLAALLGLSKSTGTWWTAGIAWWTVTALGLAAYALGTGNQRWTALSNPSAHSAWTGIGILQGLFCAFYLRFAWFSDRVFLITWAGIVACGLSWLIYQAPWQRWGWPLRPWQLLALWLPICTLGAAVGYRVPAQCLLLVGAFYAWMAKQRDRLRLSYISVLLFDWALLRYLSERGWLTALMLSLVLGVSVLYWVEIEPYFQGLSKRQQRHWLRSLTSALIGLTAMYQTEIYQPLLLYAAITLALALGFVLAGLALKVRAFLYVGTLIFVVQIMRVLWLLISNNSLLLWAVGIALGLTLIWVAATFESRRGRRQRSDEPPSGLSSGQPSGQPSGLSSGRLESWSAALQTWD